MAMYPSVTGENFSEYVIGAALARAALDNPAPGSAIISEIRAVLRKHGVE
jgi:hypothetical protein